MPAGGRDPRSAGRGAERWRRARRGRAFQSLALAFLLAALLPLGLARPAGSAAYEPLILDSREYPWSAIGRVNSAGQTFCTGFLVGPRVVLSAAHCLFNIRTGRWYHPSEVHFVAGYQRDSYLAHSTALDYRVSASFHPNEKPDEESALDDWAVITLNKPLGEEVGWLGIDRLDSAKTQALVDGLLPAFQVGYRRDRAHVQTIRANCPVPGLFGGGIGILHGCDVIEGASGSPFLTFEEGMPRVLGIHTARVEAKNGEAFAGVLSLAIFHPSWGRKEPIEAALAAHLAWGAGQAPKAGGAVPPVPTTTIDLLLGRLGYLPPEAARAPGREQRRQAILAFEKAQGMVESGEASLALLAKLVHVLR